MTDKTETDTKTNTIKKDDFIELNFTGKANDEIFDTTIPELAKEINPNANIKPMIVSVGNQMLLKGFDETLIGKEYNKDYTINLIPDLAFGKRDPKLIRVVPLKFFKDKDINPVQGMTLEIDNHVSKILSASGGRITADFNNPLAGKDVTYDFKITKKIINIKEKVHALQDFFFNQRFDFTVNNEDKKVIFQKPELKPLAEMMNKQWQKILGFEFSVKEEKKEDKKKEESEEKQEINSKVKSN